MTSGNTPTKAVAKRGNTGRTTKQAAKKPTRGTKYPWEQVRAAFIEGLPVADGGEYERTFLNQKEISEHFSIPYQRVRETASKERWTEQRHAYQVETAQKRQKERQEKILGDALDFDDKTLKVAQVGIAMIQARFAEIASDVKRFGRRRELAIQKMEAGEKVEPYELYSAINYREMESLASAAARLQEIGNKALGTDVTRHEVSGPGGGPIQIDAVSVAEELLRDDPERLTALLAASQRAGLIDDDNIYDAEIVEEQEDAEDGDTEELVADAGENQSNSDDRPATRSRLADM